MRSTELDKSLIQSTRVSGSDSSFPSALVVSSVHGGVKEVRKIDSTTTQHCRAEQGIQRHDMSKVKEFIEGGEDDLAPGRAGPEEVGSIIRPRSTRDG